MKLDPFTSTKNWNFTERDQIAEIQFEKVEASARVNAPRQFHHMYTLTHLEYMQSTALYGLLKTLPKGVMHHNHFTMNEDIDFYREHIITKPYVYLAKDQRSFKIGNKQQASEGQWISFAEAKKKYQNQEAFVKAVSNISILSKAELQELACKQQKIWSLFDAKSTNFAEIISELDIFRKYVRHVFLKYLKNGYDRLEFRQSSMKLREFDQEGNLLKIHGVKKHTDTIDEIYNELKLIYPSFTIGWIFTGHKRRSAEESYLLFVQICELNWDKTLGLDFVQQEDPYGSLEKYDQIVDRVLDKFKELDLKKVYHAGETKDTENNNIDIAIKSGSVRIGHGLNILQRIDFLPYCKHICFERNPISNLVLGYENDTRESSTPTLLGLGYAVSISPDGPGKFGVEDTTADYFIAALSYRWTLTHFKLIAYHSINHAICQEHVRSDLLKSFNYKWNLWVNKFIGERKPEKLAYSHIKTDIFTNTHHWSFSTKEQSCVQKFQSIRSKVIKQLPQQFYKEKVLASLDFIKKTNLFQELSSIPKGVCHHIHFDHIGDQDFFRLHVINDPLVFLAKNKKSFKIGTKQQATQENWISLQSYRKQFQSQSHFVREIAKLTIISAHEIEEISGNASKFSKVFQDKSRIFQTILFARHIFQKYVKHILLKLIKNGYERVQFRAQLYNLTSYDSEGNINQKHDEKQYMIAFDEVYNQIKIQYPSFSVGFIFCGAKTLAQQENQKLLTKICELRWNKTIGFDICKEVNHEMDWFDRIVDKVLMKFPEVYYKKVYSVGDSQDHYDNSIEVAVRAGSVRIGNGLNIFQKVEFLPQCKSICFELNPISNFISGHSNKRDLRLSTAPTLLGLGYPVSISPHAPGKFGYQDTTVDYFAAAVSFHWSFKHFKLIAIHSINHAICTQGMRKLMHINFDRNWNTWIQRFLNDENITFG